GSFHLMMSEDERNDPVSIFKINCVIYFMFQFFLTRSMGVIFGVSESSAHRIATWVEDVLISSGTFSLPSKKVLLEEDSTIEIVWIDATEQEIERPKKTK
ncbi:hypothetical protein ACT453_41980, partial [Bacillus sp. D-CC]